MRILIDRESCRGDIVAATCVLPGLKRRYSPCRITWRVLPGDWGDPLLGNPYIDQIVHVANPRDFDVVYYPDHASDWRGPMEAIYCEQLGLDFHGPEIYLTAEERAFTRSLPRPYLVIVVEAGWKSRVWPHAYWDSLIKQLRKAGYYVVQVVAPHEQALSTPNQVIRSTLRNASAVIGEAALYVGADTYGLHAAVALGTPVVAIMCPTGPENIWLGEHGVAVRPPYEPCTWSRRDQLHCPNRECPSAGGAGSVGITRVTAEQVLETVMKASKNG